MKCKKVLRVTNDHHIYLLELAHKLSVATGKRVGMNDVLCGMIDHYRLGQESNEKVKQAKTKN